MADRLDALTARNWTDREGNVKTNWSKIGAAFAGRDGSWRVVLDALPLPSLNRDGAMETVIHLREPRARDDAPRGNGPAASNNRAPVDNDLDDAPF